MPRPKATPLGLRGLVGLLALLATLLVGQGLAMAAGSISGRVTDTSGTPLENICVEAEAPIFGGTSNRSAETTASGHYTIEDVFAYDDYRVFFHNCGGGNLAPEYFLDAADQATAQPVVVRDGEVTPNVTATLAPGGSVSGTVTSGSQGLSDVCVEVLKNGVVISSSQTGADGAYQVPNLPAGPVKVRFARCADYDGIYVGEYWDNQQSIDNAGVVTIVAGSDHPEVNADLPVEGEITGRVTAEQGGATLAGICVDALDAAGAEVGSAVTDDVGNYRIGGLLTAGDYNVRFSDCDNEQYLTEYYDGATSLAAADDVAVASAGTTPNIDATLQRKASVAGTVTNVGGQPIADACIGLYDSLDALQATAVTNPSGQYSIDKIVPGSYRVGFITTGLDSSCGPVNYLTEYYSEASTLALATQLALAPDQNLTGVDAILSRGGAILGHVTDLGLSPLSQICADAYDDLTGVLVSSAQTDGSGDYSIGGLESGSYRVGFRDCNTGLFLSEYYSDKPDFAAADPIPVIAGEDTSGNDAELADAGVITGEVTDANGTLLNAICVSAEDATGTPLGTGSTGSDGVYRIGGLPAGQYFLHFDDCFGNDFRAEYYSDQPDLLSAQEIGVVGGQEYAANASLARGGSITGRVTGQADAPLPGICVRATDSNGVSVVDLTDAGGDYSVDGLGTDSYEIRFSDCSAAGYLTEFYADQPDASTATLVPATFDQVTPGIDAQLTLGGKITGTVTDAPNSQPLANVCVEAVGTSETVTAVTAADGTYAVKGLAGGNYQVRFEDCGADVYRSEYYDDALALVDADPVAVAVSATSPDVNAGLALPASISGRVTNAVDKPLQGVCIDAYDSADALVSSATTNVNGLYSVGQLNTGDIRLRFRACQAGNYFDEYYNDKATLAAADAVPVVDGIEEPSVDASLTSPDTDPPDTQVSAGPSGFTIIRSPVFTFSTVSSEPGATFSCKLDGPGATVESFAPCPPPNKGYNNLPDGTYEFAVFATDDVGNPDLTAATRSFTVDTTAPETAIDSGPSGATGNNDPTFGLSSDQSGSTFECRLDGPGAATGTFAPCGASNAYTNLVDGDYELQARATDPAGNVDDGPDIRSFTVDTAAPQTSIGTGPNGLSSNNDPSFSFGSSESGSAYTCRLDGPAATTGSWASCPSPKSYSNLADGSYALNVKATDPVGNEDATAATSSFSIDTTAPDTSISSGPDGTVGSGDVQVAFSGSSGTARYECRLDGPSGQGSFGTCSSPQSYGGLAVGEYTFSVRTVDSAGNTDASPATRKFAIGDTTAPETTLTKTPKAKISSKKKTVKASFLFTASEVGGFECSLDGSDFSLCTSPFKTKVKTGKHSFAVRAVDEADNADATPAEFAFQVKKKKSKKK